MKKICLFLNLFLLFFFFQFATGLHAQGSVEDTIHSAGESGQESPGLTTDPVNSQRSNAESFLEDQSPVVQTENSSKQNGKILLATTNIDDLINQIIAQIEAAYGAGAISGVRIIIIRIGPDSISNPATPSPVDTSIYTNVTVNTNTSVDTSSTANTPTNPTTSGSSIAGLKAQLQASYGISADENGAKWTQKEIQAANDIMATLPKAFWSCTKSILRETSYMSPNVLGYVQMGIPQVHLENSCCYNGTFQGTLVHEMTHNFQAAHPDVTNAWENQFWPNGNSPVSSSVSAYGNTQPLEDFAESVRTYWQSGPEMKAQYPDRYQFIKDNVMGGKEY
ncbi:MAG: hypothetical protein HQM08_05410 [Candidatus Riflebacteria bacterium]|nr:hypothetical protein [Candidatus Riflebacteria bacterium]